MGLASRMLRIRTGEGRLVASLVGLMFVSMAAIVIGESAIDALFFDRIGTDVLPQMYLLQGAADVRRDARSHLGAGQGRRTSRVPARAAHARRARAGRAHRAHHRRPVDLPGPVGHGRHRDAHPGRSSCGERPGPSSTSGRPSGCSRSSPPAGSSAPSSGGVLTRPLAAAIGAENLLLVWAGALGVAFAPVSGVAGSDAGRARTDTFGASTCPRSRRWRRGSRSSADRGCSCR